MKEEKSIEFSKLKFAYVTVKNFLEDESGEDISLKVKIEGDLGMRGGDSHYLLSKFVEKFELDNSGFDIHEHFHSEGEVADPNLVLFNLLTLSVWLPLKTIELLTLNTLKIKKPSFHMPERPVTDMTFKDLLTWYIEGKYVNSENIKYLIKEG